MLLAANVPSGAKPELDVLIQTPPLLTLTVGPTDRPLLAPSLAPAPNPSLPWLWLQDLRRRLAPLMAASDVPLTDWSQVFDMARIGVFVIPLRSDPAERQNRPVQAADTTGRQDRRVSGC